MKSVAKLVLNLLLACVCLVWTKIFLAPCSLNAGRGVVLAFAQSDVSSCIRVADGRCLAAREAHPAVGFVSVSERSDWDWELLFAALHVRD